MTEENYLHEVKLQTLTKLQWLSLCWAFWWRGLCLLIGSGVTGGIVGGIYGLIVGFIGAAVGIDAETVNYLIFFISFFMGIIIGILFFIVFIKWIFKAKFSTFRLALVSLNEDAS